MLSLVLSACLVGLLSAATYSDDVARNKMLPLAAAAYSNNPQLCLTSKFTNAVVSNDKSSVRKRVEKFSAEEGIQHRMRLAARRHLLGIFSHSEWGQSHPSFIQRHARILATGHGSWQECPQRSCKFCFIVLLKWAGVTRVSEKIYPHFNIESGRRDVYSWIECWAVTSLRPNKF